MTRRESSCIGNHGDAVLHQFADGHGVECPARKDGRAGAAVSFFDRAQAGSQIAGGDFRHRTRGIDMLQNRNPRRIRRGTLRVELQFDVPDDIEILGQRLTRPCQARCWGSTPGLRPSSEP
jgi:hypothetical protein